MIPIFDPVIRTYSGHHFDFLEPAKSVFGIEDIARALSKICRFTGHTKEFYSVAQHSVLVSLVVPPEDAFAGLMHDASEAFIGDVSSPLKALLPEYKIIERKVEAEVLGRFGLPAHLPPSVKKADLILLKTEQRDVMEETNDWGMTAMFRPLEERIVPLDHTQAYELFMRRYIELRGNADFLPIKTKLNFQ